MGISLKLRIWETVHKFTGLVPKTNAAREFFSKRTLSVLITIYGLSCVLTSLAFVSLPPQEIDGFVGYYALGDGSSWLRLTENIDLQTVITQAQAHGYNATYRPASRVGMRYDTGLPNSSRIVSGLKAGGIRYIGIAYFVGANETFDYAVPRFASIDCPYEVSDEWVRLRLQEFFPQLTEDESSDFAKRSTTSDYNSIDISGSPVWEKISEHLGALSDVSCVPVGSVYAHYSEGMIEYEVPSVAISKEMTLIWDRPVFIISANIWGFVSVKVNSKYMLNKNWITRVFARMFANIGLPVEGIKRYSIYENWLAQLD